MKKITQMDGMSGLKLAVNALMMVINGFLLAIIICLYVFQPSDGKRVNATINSYRNDRRQYYEEGEVYRQVNDDVDTYRASGRPD
ncbi:hypothetical protein INP51_01365 [Blautia liquoris]|uniref:Uncharacterized protein n=1 Tax=Blautia liquoris TaxID=2779518 RepID=A0A7M2RI41_9FIRM|nr:hypothetical protein [Blautia liquoris]QOV19654.1 hypothetical protein INP51_01365 [Blautia liquoris]